MQTTHLFKSYSGVRYFPRNVPAVGDTGYLGTYEWLTRVPVSRMVTEAIVLWQAVAAVDGTSSTVVSDAEFRVVTRGSTLQPLDAVSRAGIVLAVLAWRARKTIPEMPQCALQWSTYGMSAGQPRLGDVLCLLADAGARVGLYVGEDDAAYHCLGATAADRVGVERVAKSRLYAVRRPLYEGTQFAANGIRLNRDGTLIRMQDPPS